MEQSTKQIRINAGLHKCAKIFGSKFDMTISKMAEMGIMMVMEKISGKSMDKLSTPKKK